MAPPLTTEQQEALLRLLDAARRFYVCPPDEDELNECEALIIDAVEACQGIETGWPDPVEYRDMDATRTP